MMITVSAIVMIGCQHPALPVVLPLKHCSMQLEDSIFGGMFSD